MYNSPINMPVEVRVCINDPEIAKSANTKDLLILLQDIADEWFVKQIPTTPCGYISKYKGSFNATN